MQTTASQPSAITKGPDGNMWFTELTGGKIGRITTNGLVSEFPIPVNGPNPAPSGIVTGPDGNLWFGEQARRIGNATTSGVITDYLTGGGSVYGITLGPDSALWFVDQSSSKIGRAK